MEQFERPTDEARTLPQALRILARIQPERVAMRMKEYGIWHDITWEQYARTVRHVAMGLHALGVRRGDHVSIIGENKPGGSSRLSGVHGPGRTS